MLFAKDFNGNWTEVPGVARSDGRRIRIARPEGYEAIFHRDDLRSNDKAEARRLRVAFRHFAFGPNGTNVPMTIPE